MTDILSTISGQFSKSLILGAFLPTVVFVTLSIIFLIPLIPTDWPILVPIITLSPQWKVIVIAFITIMLSGVLYNLNIPIIRLYEGYPWKESWIGKWRTRHYKAKFKLVSSRWTGMRTLLLKLPPDDPRKAKIEDYWAEMGQKFNINWGAGESLILPTRLGNAVRSFEYYPNHQYGIDDVALWPRMVAKIDKDYAALIDDAKTSFDFMLNNSFLFSILALSLLITGLLYPGQLASPNRITLVLWLLQIIIFGGIAYWLYSMSVGRAVAWGNTVRAAYDLYRWDLLKQLGYKQTPVTRKEERQLWEDITRRIIYGKPPLGADSDYSKPEAPSTFVKAKQKDISLELVRGVKRSQDDKGLTIVLCVRNKDRERDAERVVVTDTLPKGFDYEWGSVQPANIKVAGINPYRFKIRTLARNSELIITYRAMSRAEVGHDGKSVLPLSLQIEAHQVELTAGTLNVNSDSQFSTPKDPHE